MLTMEYGGLGSKNLKVWRRVLLAKHAAKVVLQPLKLCSSIIIAKYLSLLSYTMTISPVWKLSNCQSTMVRNDCCWAIGDSENIQL